MLSRIIDPHNPDFASFILRITVGAVFLAQGFGRLQDVSGALSAFEAMGLPAAIGYLVIILEVVGGLLLVLGFFTKYIAWLFAILMAGNIALVTGRMGFSGGYDFNLLLLIASIAVVFLPEGRWTLSRMFGRR